MGTAGLKGLKEIDPPKRAPSPLTLEISVRYLNVQLVAMRGMCNGILLVQDIRASAPADWI
jgi:hypothetical protein